jgi:hypothetical protein
MQRFCCEEWRKKPRQPASRSSDEHNYVAVFKRAKPAPKLVVSMFVTLALWVLCTGT